MDGCMYTARRRIVRICGWSSRRERSNKGNSNIYARRYKRLMKKRMVSKSNRKPLKPQKKNAFA